LPSRSTNSTLFCCLSGTGHTEVGGQILNWEENDIFVIPNHQWHHHGNDSVSENAILYSINDRPLLEKIGHYRRQGRNSSGSVVDL
jgi:gentisate 1,2-dioxygenase